MGNKKIAICASGSFVEDAKVWKRCFEGEGYDVIKIPEVVTSNYEEVHTLHYQKIAESDILFILNQDKNEISNYIGPSVFAEIAFAIGLNLTLRKQIKVLCLNPIPVNMPYTEELLRWEKLGWLGRWEGVTF